MPDSPPHPLAWLAAHAENRRTAGLRRTLRPRAARDTLIDLAGNDYLGLATDPRVIAGAIDAVRVWGAGSGGSRLVTGSTALHAELEGELAAFTGFAGALVFSSGFLANLGVVTALSGPGTLIVSDAANHASLVDACRLARARVAIAPRDDPEAVAALLAARTEERALVVVDSVNSVDSGLAPLRALHAVCRAGGALLVVDEAHGLGVRGPGGRGLLAEVGLAGADDVVATVTLSKALGTQGGAVLGSAAVIAHLVDTARSFIFDTGLAPACVGAALAALRVLRGEPERTGAVLRVAAALAAAAGVPAPSSAVVSVVLGDPQRALAAAGACAERGVRVGCLRPPSVPAGTSRLRVTARATLTDAELGRAAAVLRACASAAPESIGRDTAPARARGRAPTGATPQHPSAAAATGAPPAGSVWVVSGTGTGVGKTIVTAALAALATGRVAVLKPAQTGVAPDEPGDLAEVARLVPGVTTRELGRFPDPLAPATAARRAGHPAVRPADAAAAARELVATHDLVLIEGAGGLLVRLDDAGGTLADVAAELGAPVLVVAAAGLGTLNHTELTVRELTRRGLTCAGIVVGAWPTEPDLAATCNLADLPAVTGVPLLGVVPAGAGAATPPEFARLARHALAPVLGGKWQTPQP